MGKCINFYPTIDYINMDNLNIKVNYSFFYIEN